MNISDSIFNKVVLSVAVVFAATFFYGWLIQNEMNEYFLFVALGLFFLAYRFTKSFNNKNSLTNLLKRNGDEIEISRLRTVPFVDSSLKITLEVNRISKVTIGKNWLSIIVDGNGNGYDFQLLGSGNDIHEHFSALFNPEELSCVDIHRL